MKYHKQAMDHTEWCASEYLPESDDLWGMMGYTARRHFAGKPLANTIDTYLEELRQRLQQPDTDALLKQHYPKFSTEAYLTAVRSFYEAMLKVCAHIEQVWKEDSYHAGTDDRNWYRVWWEITGYHNGEYKGYFSGGDSARDQRYANVFADTGACTQQQYERYQRRFNTAMQRYVKKYTTKEPA
jgi:hypothetical protein